MTLGKTATGLIGANIMVGSMPNITGSATETGLKSNFSKGVANIGTAMPIAGKVKGAGMVFKSIKRIKLQGGKKL